MFEWDEDKNAANIAKHGVSFQRASRIFEGRVLTVVDSRADHGEVREISIGIVESILFLTVVHTATGRGQDHLRPASQPGGKETL